MKWKGAVTLALAMVVMSPLSAFAASANTNYSDLTPVDPSITYSDLLNTMASRYESRNYLRYPVDKSVPPVAIADGLNLYPDAYGDVADFINHGYTGSMTQSSPSGGPPTLDKLNVDTRTLEMMGGLAISGDTQGGLAIVGKLSLLASPTAIAENNKWGNMAHLYTVWDNGVPTIRAEHTSMDVNILQDCGTVSGYVVMNGHLVRTTMLEYIPRYIGTAAVGDTTQLVTNPAYPTDHVQGNINVFDTATADGTTAIDISWNSAKLDSSPTQYLANPWNAGSGYGALSDAPLHGVNGNYSSTVGSYAAVLEKSIGYTWDAAAGTGTDYVEVTSVADENLNVGTGRVWMNKGSYYAYRTLIETKADMLKIGGANVAITGVTATISVDGKDIPLQKISLSYAGKPIKLNYKAMYTGGKKDPDSVTTMVTAVKNDMYAPAGVGSGSNAKVTLKKGVEYTGTLTTTLNSSEEISAIYNMGVSINTPQSMEDHYFNGDAKYVSEVTADDDTAYIDAQKDSPDFVISKLIFYKKDGSKSVVDTFPTLDGTVPVYMPSDTVKVGAIAENVNSAYAGNFPVTVNLKVTSPGSNSPDTYTLRRQVTIDNLDYKINGLFIGSSGGIPLLNNDSLMTRNILGVDLPPRTGEIRSGYPVSITNGTYDYTALYDIISDNSTSTLRSNAPTNFATDSTYENRARQFHQSVVAKMAPTFLGSDFDLSNRKSDGNKNPLITNLVTSEHDFTEVAQTPFLSNFKQVVSNTPDKPPIDVKLDSAPFSYVSPDMHTTIYSSAGSDHNANQSPQVMFSFDIPSTANPDQVFLLDFHVFGSAEKDINKGNNDANAKVTLGGIVNGLSAYVSDGMAVWPDSNPDENTNPARNAIQVKKTYTYYTFAPHVRVSSLDDPIPLDTPQVFDEGKLDYAPRVYPQYVVTPVNIGEAYREFTALVNADNAYIAEQIALRTAENAKRWTAHINSWVPPWSDGKGNSGGGYYAIAYNPCPIPSYSQPQIDTYTEYYHTIKRVVYSYPGLKFSMGLNQLSKDYTDDTQNSDYRRASASSDLGRLIDFMGASDGALSSKFYIDPYEQDGNYKLVPVIAQINPILFGIRDGDSSASTSFTYPQMSSRNTALGPTSIFNLAVSGSLIDDVHEASIPK